MARSFNGSSDVINLGTPSALNLAGSNITVSCWANASVFPSGSATVGTLVEHGYDGTTEQWFLRYAWTGTQVALDFGMFNTGTGAVNVRWAPVTNSTGTWYHVLGLFNGSAYAVYSGGVQQNLIASSQALLTSTARCAIGASEQSGTFQRFFNGNIADAAVWNTALSDGEVAALAKGARPYSVRPGSLVGYWPLDGLQSPEPDLSGKANNGTLTGTALVSGPPVMQFTPRWPQFNPAAAAPTFSPAWALNRNTVIEGAAT
jgi:hypothetical protein